MQKRSGSSLSPEGGPNRRALLDGLLPGRLRLGLAGRGCRWQVASRASRSRTGRGPKPALCLSLNLAAGGGLAQSFAPHRILIRLT